MVDEIDHCVFVWLWLEHCVFKSVFIVSPFVVSAHVGLDGCVCMWVSVWVCVCVVLVLVRERKSAWTRTYLWVRECEWMRVCFYILGWRPPKTLLEKDSLDSDLKNGTDVDSQVSVHKIWSTVMIPSKRKKTVEFSRIFSQPRSYFRLSKNNCNAAVAFNTLVFNPIFWNLLIDRKLS